MHSTFVSNSCSPSRISTSPGHAQDVPRFHQYPAVEEREFLDDMDFMLQESALPWQDEDIQKPRACRNLATLMSCDEGLDSHPPSTPRRGLRKRFESFWEEDSIRDYQTDLQSEKGQLAPLVTCHMKEELKYEAPLVWRIQPVFDKKGKLRFQFSTHSGTNFAVKGKMVLESIEVINVPLRYTHFQVYAFGGGASRIVSRELITEEIRDVLDEAKVRSNGHHSCDQLPTKFRGGSLHQRLRRFCLHRRWKNTVKHEAALALGDVKRDSYLRSAAFPFRILQQRSPHRTCSN